jgi:hypothetical protein
MAPYFFSLLLPGIAFGEKPTKNNPLVIKEDKKQLLIAGYVQAKKYNKKPLLPFGHTKNWHGIVWEGGRTKKSDILFVSYTNDLSVYNALIQLGATPGNNLSAKTWEMRGNRSHPEPNKKVEGTLLAVSVSWEGAPRNYALSDLIKDPGGKGLSLKFGGNKDMIPIWKSGCIICLYSCPGGKISNAAYTANDYMFNTTHFSAKEGLLPPDGTEVIITISIPNITE